MRVNVCSAVLVPCVFSLAQLILRVEVSQGLSLVVTRKMDGRGGRGDSRDQTLGNLLVAWHYENLPTLLGEVFYPRWDKRTLPFMSRDWVVIPWSLGGFDPLVPRDCTWKR